MRDASVIAGGGLRLFRLSCAAALAGCLALASSALAAPAVDEYTLNIPKPDRSAGKRPGGGSHNPPPAPVEDNQVAALSPAGGSGTGGSGGSGAPITGERPGQGADRKELRDAAGDRPLPVQPMLPLAADPTARGPGGADGTGGAAPVLGLLAGIVLATTTVAWPAISRTRTTRSDPA